MVIRIGTWNLENLFKPPNPFAPKTEQEYQAKLDALASALTRMDPQVLAVQEIGDPVALGELADRVGGTECCSPRWRRPTPPASSSATETGLRLAAPARRRTSRTNRKEPDGEWLLELLSRRKGCGYCDGGYPGGQQPHVPSMEVPRWMVGVADPAIRLCGMCTADIDRR